MGLEQTENVILSWVIMFTPFWHFTEESIAKEKKDKRINIKTISRYDLEFVSFF